MTKAVNLSVIIPVCERSEDIIKTYHGYKEQLDKLEKTVEYIFAITPSQAAVREAIKDLQEQGEPITIIVLRREFGEGTAIKAGFKLCSGENILTLSPYQQVKLDNISRLFEKLDDNELVISKRWPRYDGKFNMIQTRIFRYLMNRFAGTNFSDLGCSVRLMKREVLEDIEMYGDQHRFLPLLASFRGFRIAEVELEQAEADIHQRIYSVGIYVRRLLDLITIVFLTKFNKKPLRFFGLIGFSASLLGFLMLCLVVVERFFFDVPASDRPLLLISVLMFVLGIQLAAIGLVGETIIFAHAKDNKEYQIREIIN